MANNLKLDAIGETRERLLALLSLCTSSEGRHAEFRSWEERGEELIFYYWSTQGTIFPSKVLASTVTDMILGWLKELPVDKWPKEPGIDGDCHRGWFLMAEDDRVTIQPGWMIYHK